MEAIGLFEIAANMKAFDGTIMLHFFLIGEEVQLTKKVAAECLSMEMKGKQVNVGELMEAISGLEDKFYVCHAFMPGPGVSEKDLIENDEGSSADTQQLDQ